MTDPVPSKESCSDCGREKWQHSPAEDFPCGHLPSKERYPHWTCRTHGDFDARVAVGCPECVRMLREDLQRTESARVALLAENEHYKELARAAQPLESLEAKIGALLIGRGYLDRMKDQTDEDTAARIVYEFLAEARPIISAHYGRTPPPGAGQ